MYCRSSEQIAHISGGSGVSACSSPHVAHIQTVIDGTSLVPWTYKLFQVSGFGFSFPLPNSAPPRLCDSAPTIPSRESTERVSAQRRGRRRSMPVVPDPANIEIKLPEPPERIGAIDPETQASRAAREAARVLEAELTARI